MYTDSCTITFPANTYYERRLVREIIEEEYDENSKLKKRTSKQEYENVPVQPFQPQPLQPYWQPDTTWVVPKDQEYIFTC